MRGLAPPTFEQSSSPPQRRRCLHRWMPLKERPGSVADSGNHGSFLASLGPLEPMLGRIQQPSANLGPGLVKFGPNSTKLDHDSLGLDPNWPRISGPEVARSRPDLGRNRQTSARRRLELTRARADSAKMIPAPAKISLGPTNTGPMSVQFCTKIAKLRPNMT